MELNYKQFGQGDPIIILHGLFGMLDNWQTIAKKLAQHYTVFIIDQRNHGRSPHQEEFNYPLLAGDLQEFMEQQWIYKAHLIGHSMGGKTVMQFALEYPEMVDKMIVVDIAPKKYPDGHGTIFEALFSIDFNVLENRKQAESILSEKIQEAGVRQFLLKNLTRTKAGKYKWKMNLDAIHRNYDAILATIEGEPIETDSIFIKGGKSNYIQKEDEKKIQELFPLSNIVTINEAGHWVHAEQPIELLEIVTGFLSSS